MVARNLKGLTVAITDIAVVADKHKYYMVNGLKLLFRCASGSVLA
jgi:hypothetical protein